MKSPRSVWTIIREDTELVLPIFRLLKRRMRRPTDAKEGDFYIAQAPLWVNIVALTPEREVILVEQYRHGVHAVTVEVPGGVAGPVTDGFEAARRAHPSFVGGGRLGNVVFRREENGHPLPALDVHTFQDNHHVLVTRSCSHSPPSRNSSLPSPSSSSGSSVMRIS